MFFKKKSFVSWYKTQNSDKKYKLIGTIESLFFSENKTVKIFRKCLILSAYYVDVSPTSLFLPHAGNVWQQLSSQSPWTSFSLNCRMTWRKPWTPWCVPSVKENTSTPRHHEPVSNTSSDWKKTLCITHRLAVTRVTLYVCVCVCARVQAVRDGSWTCWGPVLCWMQPLP